MHSLKLVEDIREMSIIYSTTIQKLRFLLIFSTLFDKNTVKTVIILNITSI